MLLLASVSGFRMYVWGEPACVSGTLGLWERPLASAGRAALHGTHSLPHPSLNHTLPHRPPLPRPHYPATTYIATAMYVDGKPHPV